MEYIKSQSGFCDGVKLQRKPTEEEALYCLGGILGFNLDEISDEFVEMGEDACSNEEEKSEYSEFKERIIETFCDFIEGNCDWYGLCTAVYDGNDYGDNDEFMFGVFVELTKYLEEKGII